VKFALMVALVNLSVACEGDAGISPVDGACVDPTPSSMHRVSAMQIEPGRYELSVQDEQGTIIEMTDFPTVEWTVTADSTIAIQPSQFSFRPNINLGGNKHAIADASIFDFEGNKFTVMCLAFPPPAE